MNTPNASPTMKSISSAVFKLLPTALTLAGILTASASAQPITVKQTEFHGRQCLEITTPWATLYFENEPGVSGFKGVVDNEGNDWLQANYGLGYMSEWGFSGEWRGFPNATAGDFGHASRDSGSVNRIVGPSSGEHVIIESENETMKFRYHFFPSHGAIEVLKAEDTYCFLWEGTTGGSVDPEDYFVLADGEKRYGGELNTVYDMSPEWVYFADPLLHDMMLIGKYPDDEHMDENWRAFHTYELFSFGRTDRRQNWQRLLTGTEHYFFYTFLPRETSHQDVTQIAEALLQNPYEPLPPHRPHPDTIAILAPGELIDLSPGATGRNTPAKARFLAAFDQLLKSTLSFDERLEVTNPPEWGKTLSESTQGTLAFQPTFPDGFVGNLTLTGLEPGKTYRLTFNGQPGLPGNTLLPTPVDGVPNEFFYDFLDIQADSQGQYDGTFGVKLKPGDYQVRLYVKDIEDWAIVLYRDYFPFTVQ